MAKHILVPMFCAWTAAAQFNTVRIPGRVIGQTSGSRISVELYDDARHTVAESTPVGFDGSFEFRSASASVAYELRLVNESGDVIAKQILLPLRAQGAIELRLPETATKAPGGPISVQPLRRNVSPKALKLML